MTGPSCIAVSLVHAVHIKLFDLANSWVNP